MQYYNIKQKLRIKLILFYEIVHRSIYDLRIFYEVTLWPLKIIAKKDIYVLKFRNTRARHARTSPIDGREGIVKFSRSNYLSLHS